MPEETNTLKEETNPEEEIMDLEKKLEAKKKQLAEKGLALVPEEKEMLRDVLQERIEKEMSSVAQNPQQSAAPIIHFPPQAIKNEKEKEIKEKEEREEKIKILVGTALTQGIKKAVERARKSTPYLLDELHDHLVDDYYEKLITLRKIKKL